MSVARKIMVRRLIISIILIPVCIVALYLTLIRDWRFLILGETVDIHEAVSSGEDLKNLEGKFVTLRLNSCVGCFGSTQHYISRAHAYSTGGGIPVGTDYHYVAWLEDDSFLAFTVREQKQIDAANAITDETYKAKDGYSVTTYEFTGRLKPINSSELKNYYHTALKDIGVESTMIRDETVDTNDNRLFNLTIVFVAVVVLMISVSMLINAIKFLKYNK